MSYKFCLVIARKGSQRLPGKNKRLLASKPLFLWTLEAALQSKAFDAVWVSSDDHDILEMSQAFPGVEVDQRPGYLSGPRVKSYQVLTHYIDKIRAQEPGCDKFCLLQPTSPFRNSGKIAEAMNLLQSAEVDFVVGIQAYTCPPQFALSSENGLQPVEDQYLTRITHTQDVQCYFHPAGGIYAGKIAPYLETGHFYGERSAGLSLGHIAGWDINDEEAFKVAEMLARELNKEREGK